jgi:hypothetical protein
MFLVYLASPALHIIKAVPVNLPSNHSLLQLRQTGEDLTKAHLRKKSTIVAQMYLTININAFLKINIQKYIFFKPAYLVQINAC